jgi:hypothetical protein
MPDTQTLMLAAITGAFVLFAVVLGFVSIWSRGGKKKSV